MQTYRFIRTVQYTETIEVQAEFYEAAEQLAMETDGERNYDDTIIDMKRAKGCPTK